MFLRFLWGRGRENEVPSEPPQRTRQDDERFDALVRALPLGVMMLDRGMRLRYTNRSAAAIFGFDRERMQNAHLIEAVPNLELERRTQEVVGGQSGGAPFIVAGKRVSRSYAVTVYPLTDQDDDVIGALILAEDHTELLALERARQEFLSNVSHELRTPLSSVKLMLETVCESEDEDARKIFVPQALFEVDRLTSLVQRLLDQARAQSGRLVLELTQVDLEAIIQPIIRSFEPAAGTKGVALDFRPQRPVVVEGDAHRLSQVLVNLIDNALRYTNEGGAIAIETNVDGGHAIITVSDNGMGIPYKDLPHVFERFYVVDRSRARGQAGAGLGLSIVKDIVEAHGGSVTVDSLLGSGTRFTVRLPVMARAVSAKHERLNRA